MSKRLAWYGGSILAGALILLIGVKIAASNPIRPQRPPRPDNPRVRVLLEEDYSLDKKCIRLELTPDCWYEDSKGNKYILTAPELERIWNYEINLFLFNNPQSYLYQI